MQTLAQWVSLPENRSALAVLQLLDRGFARQMQPVFIAPVAPAQLGLPARLSSRTARGPLVGLKLLGVASRLAFAEDRVAHRGLTVDPAVIGSLSRHVAASRL